MITTVTTTVLAGCVVRSTKAVQEPGRVRALLKTSSSSSAGEIRLHSPSGSVTSWLPRSSIIVIGGLACVRPPERAWQTVAAIRVSELTDANIAAILVDLPRSIAVVQRAGGVIELTTAGRDLTRWLSSRAHDPADVGVRRYEVFVARWSEPVTWRELARAGRPVVGWPIEGATAELRKIDPLTSIVLSVIAAPAAVLLLGAIVAPQVVRLPSGNPPPAPSHSVLADVPLGHSPPADLPGTWAASACPEALR